jgi:hypothetical protein
MSEPRTRVDRALRKVRTKHAADKPLIVPGESKQSSKNKQGHLILAKRPKLLSGGNPQMAMADGDAPVQAYIAALPSWKRGICQRLDALVVRHAPGVRKAVKWNSPFYGIDGQGWFFALHTFTNFVKATFFQGATLRPVPGGGSGKNARWINIHEDDLDEVQMAKWLKQAATLPGWLTADIRRD